MHIEGGLGKHEGAGIRHVRAGGGSTNLRVERSIVDGAVGGSRPLIGVSGTVAINRSGHLKESRRGDEVARGGLILSAECVDGVGKSIDGVGVVVRLGTQGLEKHLGVIKGSAVINVGIRLNHPDEFLARVVEVQLDLVGRGSNRLVTSELHLLDEVLVGVLCHLAALIRVEENIVNIEGSRHQGLLVRDRGRDRAGGSGGIEGLHGPETLADGADIKVDLHFVVLQSDERERESGVLAKPEHQGDVEGGLRKCVTGGAHLGRTRGGRARTRDGGEGGVGDVGQLGSVADHLEVPTLLFRGQGKLVPDVHPVTVLAINALATNLHLHLGDEVLTDEIQPTGIDSIRTGRHHRLVDLRESHLKIGAVRQISVTGDGAGNTATEIGLAGKGLFDGLHRKVRVASVRHLPKSYLGSSSKENVLSPVRHQL